MRASFIVTTKNEATTPGVVRDIYRAFGKSAEVIIVDKSDPEYRKPLYKTGAKVVIQRKGVYEHALVEGLRLAHGDMLACIDPDGTYKINDLKRIIDYLAKHKEYAYIGGDRTGCSIEAMPRLIQLGNRYFGFLASILTGQYMRDTFSGIFAMRKSAYDTIRNMEGYIAGPTIFQLALVRKGFRVRMIPISYYPRKHSKSKISNWKPIFAIRLTANMVAGRFRPIVPRKAKTT